MSPNARAYYAADIAQFASSSVAAILGNLAANTDFDIELAQRNAWSEQIPILKTALLAARGESRRNHSTDLIETQHVFFQRCSVPLAIS